MDPRKEIIIRFINNKIRYVCDDIKDVGMASATLKNLNTCENSYFIKTRKYIVRETTLSNLPIPVDYLVIKKFFNSNNLSVDWVKALVSDDNKLSLIEYYSPVIGSNKSRYFVITYKGAVVDNQFTRSTQILRHYEEGTKTMIDKPKKITEEDIQRVLNSPFDIETHKATFVDYLEVIIDEDGVIHYAVPSHQEWLIKKACEKLNVTRDELCSCIPHDMIFDTMDWLTEETGCVSVWDTRYIGSVADRKKREALTQLKVNGLYHGAIKIDSNRSE